MNYLFTAGAIAFMGGDRVALPQVTGRSYDPHPANDAAQFGARIQDLLNLYDWEITLVQLNLLDSHDTSRLLSIARGDQATVRMATLFQMTYPGAPSVYYGDEIGLTGTVDCDKPMEDRWARRTFPWDRPDTWDRDLLAYFQAAIALRRGHPALRRGHFYQLFAEGHVFAYARRDGDETLVVVLNASEAEQIVTLSVGAYFHDGTALHTLLTSNGPRSGVAPALVHMGQLSLTLPAREGVVLGLGSG